VLVTRTKCSALDPANGKALFEFPFGQRGPTVNAATPLVFGNKFFLTASYGIGGKLFEVAKDKPATIWENDSALSSQYNTPVHNGGFLYGSHGREDGGRTSLRCVDAANGEVNWSSDRSSVASVILAGQHLIVLTADGNLSLVKINPGAYSQLAKYTVTTGVTRALPALSNGKLFIRINGDGGKNELKCFNIGAK
ncbi:MAG: outer membrane protein assembly factor BamB, partial [Pirellulaceae bacterium]